MKWTVGKKMFLIGVFVVVGVGVLAGNNFFTNTSIHKTSELMHLRNNQIDTVNGTLQSHLTLMLAAMDSIIDKDEGKIEGGRIELMNANAAIIKENLKALDELADTEEEKKLSSELHALFEKLAQGIQVDLVNLIEGSAGRVKQIQNDFIKIADTLDNYGDPIEEQLSAIYASVQEEQNEASELAARRNDQMALLNTMTRHHLDLMLAAMDSIIDKDEGKVDEGRMESINNSVEFISGHLDDLVALADTGEEKKSAEFIRDSFPKLAQGIQVDLMQLIQNRATQAEFTKIDDVLDAYGDPIEENLVRIFTSVQEEQKEASDLAKHRDQQMALISDLTRTHGNLMLAAMDSIIDKAEGNINDERMEDINRSVTYINDNLDALVSLADTGEEKKSAEFIRDTYPKLAKGIQEDLKNLIEKSELEARQIAAAFVEIDDVLDANADKLEANLLKIQASVKEEVKEAEEASQATLARSKMIGWITAFAALAGVMTALFLIARSIINPITRVTQTMGEGADQVASASGQVSSSSQSLAEGASEQAASIEETSSSLEEMSSMTKQNADNAHQADNLMKEANQVVGQANDSMGELTTSMAEISKASEETSKIIKTIDEIAFQTNLLALNAAVEAARAGEAGAGFAVVADEVRNLAMRAADAAKNTADLIEGTVKKVSDGSELVTKTNEAFTQVAESAGKVGELVGEIAAASNEQSQGIDETNKAVAEMDKVVQQNAANAEESASASEEMNAQAEQMKGMVGELVDLVGGSAKKRTPDQAKADRSAKAVAHRELLEAKTTAKTKNLALHKAQEVKPEQVIPMEDDFKDF